MLQVKHKITIGSTVYELGNSTRLVELSMQAALDVPVNACRVTLSPPLDLSINPQDTFKLELGYGDTLNLVFTGKVATADWGVERVTVYASSGFQKLVAARFNLVYENPKASDIVSDIIGRLKLSTGKSETGLTFAAYALGDNITAYDHLRALAAQCGFDLYANTEDKLVFAKYQAATTHQFTYGSDILSFSLDAQSVAVTGVEVYGESPASQGQGANASSWLTKNDVKGSAGSTSGLVIRQAAPIARTQEVAGKIASAMLAANTRQKRGVLKTLGAPAVKLGDAVQISKMPVSANNGTFKVIGVTHTLQRQRGFLSTITIQEA